MIDISRSTTSFPPHDLDLVRAQHRYSSRWRRVASIAELATLVQLNRVRRVPRRATWNGKSRAPFLHGRKSTMQGRSEARFEHDSICDLSLYVAACQTGLCTLYLLEFSDCLQHSVPLIKTKLQTETAEPAWHGWKLIDPANAGLEIIHHLG